MENLFLLKINAFDRKGRMKKVFTMMMMVQREEGRKQIEGSKSTCLL
jgi:hypothetical protein